MASSRQCLVFLLLTVAIAAAEIRDKGWWKHMVFYQVYPRSFADSNGDGVGDLPGITSKLEHFRDTGVGGIWLSPINKSPMIDFGYDISDYRDIDPTFGTLADFDALVKRAKELGLKVFLDLVPNHTSDKHEWFQKSVKREGKYTDYYVWVDGKPDKPPNNWVSVFGGSAWTYNDERKQYYLHQFVAQQPDLNFQNPLVRGEIEDVMVYWMDKGVDGFRIDAVPHIYEDEELRDERAAGVEGAKPNEYKYWTHIYTKDHPNTYKLVESWRNLLDNYANARNIPEKIMMTEAYTSLENTTRFYGVGAHVPFNFNFIMQANKDSKPAVFKRIIQEWLQSMPPGCVPNWVMGNHDRKRTATRYPGRGDQITMLEMILPGVAVTYYGEEIGMLDNDNISFEDGIDPQGCNAGKEKFKEESRDFCRTPFQWDDSAQAGFNNGTKPWLPVNENYKTVNLAKQKIDAESPYKIYTELIKLRKTSAALQTGEVIVPDINENVFAVVRKSAEETITLLMNFSAEPQEVQLSAIQVPESAPIIQSVGAGLPAEKVAKVTLPANAGVVLKA